MALYRCLSGGGTKTATGTFSTSTSTQTTMNIGFKPKQLTVLVFEGNTKRAIHSYNADVSTSNYSVAGNATYLGTANLNTTTSGRIYSINDNGFTMNKSSYVGTCYYFAIG